jgi:ribonuclease Z
MRFILLGSGAVRPDLERWGPAQIVQAAGANLMFDCGRGASMRVVQAGIPLADITQLFFTHHHFDHNCDFPYLFLGSWVVGRAEPMRIIGPRGTEAFCDAILNQAYRDDINSRRFHSQYTPKPYGCTYTARDVLEDELTVEGEGYTIKMVHVLHKPHILDNLAYRVEAEGKAIVVVGDTCACEALVALAQGADLMVHECTFPSARIESGEWGSFHTSPRELGRWAKAAGVKRLMLKHYAVQPGVEVEAMAAEVRETFGEEGLIVGEDLQVVEV